MAKREQRNRKPGLVVVKVYPATKSMIHHAAQAEGLTVVQFLDEAMRRYVVERGLQVPVAVMVAHEERVTALRAAAEAKLREQVRREILEELGHGDQEKA